MENEIKEDIGKDIFEEDAGIEEQNYYGEGQVKEGIVLPLGLALNDTELYQLSAKNKFNMYYGTGRKWKNNLYGYAI